MLQREIDPEAAADIAKFEALLPRYLAGEIEEDTFRIFRLNNGIYGQRQKRPQPDGPHQGALRPHHGRAARQAGRHRRRLLARLGPPHHPPVRAVPLRPARARPRPHPRARLGGPHHPRGLRRHRAQHPGLPPRRRLPPRAARHHAVGRGRLPALRPQPARPADAPQVQDQLLRLRHRLRPGHVQRRGRRGHHPHARRRLRRGRLPRVRRRWPRRQPAPGARPRGVHAQARTCSPPSRRSSAPSTTTATATTSSAPA